MKPILTLAAATLALASLSGCVAPVGPVEVTRFHLPDTGMLGHGPIAVEAAPGVDGSSLEFRSYAAAVAQELVRVGYSEMVAGSDTSPQVALVRIARRSYQPGKSGSPVSVGVGGSTGSYGSGVGVGVGIGVDLSGPPPEQVETLLSVTIKERASGTALWEGRASFSVRSSSPLANTQLGAPKMAEALFKDFPGESGKTIQVK